MKIVSTYLMKRKIMSLLSLMLLLSGLTSCRSVTKLNGVSIKDSLVQNSIDFSNLEIDSFKIVRFEIPIDSVKPLRAYKKSTNNVKTLSEITVYGIKKSSQSSSEVTQTNKQDMKQEKVVKKEDTLLRSVFILVLITALFVLVKFRESPY